MADQNIADLRAMLSRVLLRAPQNVNGRSVPQTPFLFRSEASTVPGTPQAGDGRRRRKYRTIVYKPKRKTRRPATRTIKLVLH